MSAILDYIASYLDLSTILICTVVFATIIWFVRRPSNLPPGPFAWPWLGSLPGIVIDYYRAGRPNPHRFLASLGNAYGNLYSLKIGSLQVVVANNLDTVQEVGQNPDATGRPDRFQPSSSGGEGK